MDKDDESMYTKQSSKGKSFAQFKIDDAIKKLKQHKIDNEKFKEFAGAVRGVDEVHLPPIRPLILSPQLSHITRESDQNEAQKN